MDSEQLLKVEQSIQNLKEKKSKIYFLVQDTKGNAKASISYIYRMALVLYNQSFNVIILHEKDDYFGVSSWLDEEYMKIPHMSIDGQKLQVSPEDFIVIPELYGFVMNQISNLPCGKIVLSQSYDYILETLQPGQSWNQFGFLKCITTSEQQKEYISSLMKNISIDVIEPYIPNSFTKNTLPANPIIGIHARDQRESLNIIKQFYLKFPQYRWITFKDMRGIGESEFANNLQKCFMSVWVDEISSYGTFPLESMKCGVPCMGVVPRMIPEWMSEDNGLWVNNPNQIVDFIGDFLQNWLEDNINPALLSEMDKTIEKLPTQESFNEMVINKFEGYLNTRLTSFEEQLNKLQTVE
jgi:hypothetical protein